jgi:hypothetical protein
MRAQTSSGLAYSETRFQAPRDSGWSQAGLKSFAYRLAHLALPRPLMISALAALFYLA